ncbi:DUF6783 domain-containing protein [Blautia wexlerae]
MDQSVWKIIPAICTPHFSVYFDIHLAESIFQTRSRACLKNILNCLF